MNTFTKLFLLIVILITAFSACEKEVSVSGPLEFEIGNNEYFISTEPLGAAIFVDKKNTGLFTPDTVKWLGAGLHNFTLKLEPYVEYSFTEELTSEQFITKNYSFLKDPINLGGIRFFSSPEGAQIYLDDSLLTSVTPFVLENLLPREYKVKYSYPEHRSDSLMVFVRPSKQAYASRTLLDTSSYVIYNIDNSFLTDNTIQDIYIDEDDFWVGTWHNGIWVNKNGNWTPINSTNSNLPYDIIHKIKKDQNNNIWIATYKGLAKITGDNIVTYNVDNSGLPNNYVTDLDFDLDGNIWIGTQRGLAKFDGISTWQKFNTSNSSIPANFITSVLVDDPDRIWLGTSTFNTFRFNKIDEWKVYQSDNSPIGDSVNDLIIDQNKLLWVGLAAALMVGKPGGVYTLNEGKLTEVRLNITDKYINCFYLDKINNMWIGTRSGIISISETNILRWYNSSNSGIPINDISSISEDKFGNMWFGTKGAGLVKYKIWNDN